MYFDPRLSEMQRAAQLLVLFSTYTKSEITCFEHFLVQLSTQNDKLSGGERKEELPRLYKETWGVFKNQSRQQEIAAEVERVQA
jgi:hypothetical protein